MIYIFIPYIRNGFVRLEQLFKFYPWQVIGDVGLPQKVTCAECNHMLYEDNILKSPKDIIKKFDGRCPECNRKLSFEAKAISILPHIEKSDK
jgi:hypothetical protein